MLTEGPARTAGQSGSVPALQAGAGTAAKSVSPCRFSCFTKQEGNFNLDCGPRAAVMTVVGWEGGGGGVNQRKEVKGRF